MPTAPLDPVEAAVRAYVECHGAPFTDQVHLTPEHRERLAAALAAAAPLLTPTPDAPTPTQGTVEWAYQSRTDHAAGRAPHPCLEETARHFADNGYLALTRTVTPWAPATPDQPAADEPATTPQGETWTQWGVQYTPGTDTAYPMTSERAARTHVAEFTHSAAPTLMRREVTATPWVPADPHQPTP